MNRLQKRQEAKRERSIASQRDRVYDEAYNKVSRDIRKIKEDVLRRAVHDLTAAFMLSLSDEFGFGRKRFDQLLEKVNKQFDCILEGHVTIDDIKNWCKEKGFNYEDILQSGK